MKNTSVILILLIITTAMSGQNTYTKADSLRGSLRPERLCYDVTFYNLDIEVDIQKQAITGFNEIHFRTTASTEVLQIDLFENMAINSIQLDGITCKYQRTFNAVFVQVPSLGAGQNGVLKVDYEGKPKIAKMPPWDGGFVWKSDRFGNPWIGVACEGAGASLWWPNKDYLGDEPDSMSIHITVPESLYCVSNGNLKQIQEIDDGKRRFSWHVRYPINNYNVSINIADYAYFSDVYTAKDGDTLDLSYYVLKENLDKAKVHFQQTQGVLEAFEHYFGKFPFWDDGFCMVETPYLGMEHQTAIAYGNQYQRGYLGGMIPRNLNFDYVIVHETGHEYWGNCISVADHAELWIHESFTTYLESLYVEYHHGKEQSIKYLLSQKPFIMNRSPIVGPLGVNFTDFRGSDYYYKGSWMLHTLRNTMENDDEWFYLLKQLYIEKACSIVNSDDIIQFFEDRTGKNYRPFFSQYLNHSNRPVLKYQFKQKGKKLLIICKWDEVVNGFEMPINLTDGENFAKIQVNQDVNEYVLPFRSLREVQIQTELGYFKTKSAEF